MVKLFCVLLGLKGSAFSVTIDESESVDDLKKAIKAENPNTITCDAKDLQLFLAEKDGGWWPDDDPAVLELEEGGIHGDIQTVIEGERMRVTWTIQDVMEDKKMPEPQSRQIHVLVVVPPATGVARRQPSGLWLVRGSIANALSTRGVRCRLYRLAGLYLGYYDPARRVGDTDSAFWYEDKTLCIHVLFDTKREALQFDNALRDDTVTIGSPLNGQMVTTTVDEVEGSPSFPERVYYAHYVTGASESPQQSMSSLSSASSATVLSRNSDEFRFQRIEHEQFFLSGGNTESCHLVSKKQSRDHKREFAQYDRDPNNRLALSREMHGFYDGLNWDVPIVNMISGAVEELPSIGNRYKVEVLVKVLNAEYKNLVFSRLKEGATQTTDDLVMKTFVHVENPETFCFCMRWKHDENDKLWEEYFAMTPAVD